jgi:hypothetical protein
MILNYYINDGFGNTMTMIVQGPTRQECDRLAQSEIDRTKVHNSNIELRNAVVTDITSDPILRSVYYNHETGEDTIL